MFYPDPGGRNTKLSVYSDWSKVNWLYKQHIRDVIEKKITCDNIQQIWQWFTHKMKVNRCNQVKGGEFQKAQIPCIPFHLRGFHWCHSHTAVWASLGQQVGNLSSFPEYLRKKKGGGHNNNNHLLKTVMHLKQQQDLKGQCLFHGSICINLNNIYFIYMKMSMVSMLSKPSKIGWLQNHGLKIPFS